MKNRIPFEVQEWATVTGLHAAFWLTRPEQTIDRQTLARPVRNRVAVIRPRVASSSFGQVRPTGAFEVCYRAASPSGWRYHVAATYAEAFEQVEKWVNRRFKFEE